MPPSDGSQVSAVNTTAAILEAVRTKGETGVTELARTLDVSKSNIHKHLTTLTHHGFIRKVDSRYRLGPRFVEFGSEVQRQSMLVNQAVDCLQRLADTTDNGAVLTTPQKVMGTYVYTATPRDKPLRSDKEGKRRPLHRTASGQAILAVDSHGVPTQTVDSLSDDALGDLKRQLRVVADTGVAVVDDEDDSSQREIAAPVVVRGYPIAAVGLVVDNATEENRGLDSNYIPLVKQTAKTVSKRMYFYELDPGKAD